MNKIGASKESLLKATKPLYGLSESPGYWWSTFRDHHDKTLQMSTSVLDLCLLYKTEQRDDGKYGLIDIQGVFVDDTLGTGNTSFADEEEMASGRFVTKPRCRSFPMKFNGITIDRQFVQGQRIYKLSQNEYAKTIQPVSPQASREDFAHVRGQVAYVSCATRLDVAYLSGQLSQTIAANATGEDRKMLNKAVRKLHEGGGICIPKLDLDTVMVAGYSDASFAGNRELSSQIGIVVLLKDGKDNAALIHYCSKKCRRVTRSILAAEVHAFAAF